ncbi:hypothetical protein FB107DRAFT_279582 [Schizophyllum commune]
MRLKAAHSSYKHASTAPLRALNEQQSTHGGDGGRARPGRRHTSSSEDESSSDSSDGEDVYSPSLFPADRRPHSSPPPYPIFAPVRDPLSVAEAAEIRAQEEAGPLSETHPSSESEVDLPSMDEISDFEGLDFFEKIDMAASRLGEDSAIDYFSSGAPHATGFISPPYSPTQQSLYTHSSDESVPGEEGTMRAHGPDEISEEHVQLDRVKIFPVEDSYLQPPSLLELDSSTRGNAPSSPPAADPFITLDLPPETPRDSHSRSLASPESLCSLLTPGGTPDSMPPLQPISYPSSDPSDESSSDSSDHPDATERAEARNIEHDWARIQDQLRTLSPSDFWGALDEDWGEVLFEIDNTSDFDASQYIGKGVRWSRDLQPDLSFYCEQILIVPTAVTHEYIPSIDMPVIEFIQHQLPEPTYTLVNPRAETLFSPLSTNEDASTLMNMHTDLPPTESVTQGARVIFEGSHFMSDIRKAQACTDHRGAPITSLLTRVEARIRETIDDCVLYFVTHNYSHFVGWRIDTKSRRIEYGTSDLLLGGQLADEV